MDITLEWFIIKPWSCLFSIHKVLGSLISYCSTRPYYYHTNNDLSISTTCMRTPQDKTVLALHDAKIPMCVASGSPRDRVLLSLEVGGIGHCFQENEVFTRELVSKGKPAPDLFLYSAEQMGVRPERCIVIEDSPSGIEAALAAGMDCISFLGGGHAQEMWYREKILSYSSVVPTYQQSEVLSLLLS